MPLVRKTLAALAFGMVFASLSLVPATAAEPRQPETPIARMNVGPISVDWRPAVDYENLVLTVAGPNDFYIHQEFVPGQAPSLSLFQPGGERLPDGVYAYELRAVLRQDQKLHEKSAEAREAEDDFDAQELQEVGKLPEGPLMQSGHLWVQEGSFVAKFPVPLSPPNQRGSASKSPIRNLAAEDIVYNEDLIVKAQACIGSDCLEGDANGPILTLKEIFGGQIKFKAMDCCVPYARSWALQANDPIAGNGDFSIRDSLQGTIPFRIGAAAPDNALTIWFNGNVGLGTLTPGAKLHLFGTATADVFGSVGPNPASGPALNFGYGGASFGRGAGFLNARPDASATWPNPSLRFLTANAERMIITSTGNVGIGTNSPGATLHVASGEVRIPGGTDSANGFPTHFRWPLDGKNYIRGTTIIADDGGSVGIGTQAPSSKLHVNGGDIRVSGGSFIDDGVTLNAPDYVFEPSYELMPLAELREFVAREKHLPNVPAAADIKKEGLNLSQFQMRLLEKIEELALYTLKQEEDLQSLRDENLELKARLEALENAQAFSKPR